MIGRDGISGVGQIAPTVAAHSSALLKQAPSISPGITSVFAPAQLISSAQSAIINAEQAVSRLHQSRSPVEVGNMLRGIGENIPAISPLDAARGTISSSASLLSARTNSGFDINPFDDVAELGKKAFDGLRDVGGAIKDSLASLPSTAANRVADSMRGPHARKLTAGEEQTLRKVFGDSIDLSNVRIVDGPGYNPDAYAAFNIGGNPAITEGNTVYIRSDHFQKDFSTSPEGVEMLVHEFTHVRQYQEMGFGSFFAKYAKDLATVGDRNKIYDYKSRPDTTFKTETLEGQAQMVGDYARYKAGDSNFSSAEIRDLERRLKGTGLFGL